MKRAAARAMSRALPCQSMSWSAVAEAEPRRSPRFTTALSEAAAWPAINIAPRAVAARYFRIIYTFS
jgi:hypothetical protein